MLTIEASNDPTLNPLLGSFQSSPSPPDSADQREWMHFVPRKTAKLKVSRDPLPLFGKVPVLSVVATIRHLEGWRIRSEGATTIETLHSQDALDEGITALYEELRELLVARDSGSDSPDLQSRIGALLQRISALEVAEAEWLGRKFQDNLEMPLGSGSRILQEIEEFLSLHEDSAATDTAADASDHPSA